jgi:hypothetical protein
MVKFIPVVAALATFLFQSGVAASHPSQRLALIVPRPPQAQAALALIVPRPPQAQAALALIVPRPPQADALA